VSLFEHRFHEDSSEEFGTPIQFVRPLATALDGFDVDPASGAEAQPLASTRYDESDDGLAQEWHGDVWLNPPWSTNGNGSAKERWLTKARSEAKRAAVDRVVVVMPSDTGAHWFHEHVLAANAVCFVGPGRIPFEGEDRNPSFALVIAVFGPVDDSIADALDSLGAVVRGRSLYEPAPQATLAQDTVGGPNDD